MKMITWPELWPEQRLIAAEAAHNRAANALEEAKSALARIDQPSVRCVAIKAEIEEERRRFLAADTREKMDLADSRRKQLYEALLIEETTHEATQPERWDAAEEEIAFLTDALGKARQELDRVKIRVKMAYNSDAPGPIYCYGTLNEAVRAICPVRIEKNQVGETYAQVEGVRIRITGDASLTSIPPSSLSWVPKSNPPKEVSLSPAMKIFAHVVYIAEDDVVLVRGNSGLNADDVNLYARFFGSLDAALRPFVSELNELGSVNISTAEALPLLGEVIREACQKISADSAGQPKFLPGQRRLQEGQIDALIGAYWRTFINAPWDASIAGSYALLKHRCARGETPNVFAYDTHGHFGFRVRTPDHDWIIGEIYCPPEHFAPVKSAEGLELINYTGGEDWLAELGPVKFLIRGKTSRN